MPVIKIGKVGHILQQFVDYPSSLTDPLYDGGERLSSLHLVVDKTDNQFPLIIIGSKGLLRQVEPHAGRGEGKTVKITVLPAGMVEGQSDPLTDGLSKEDIVRLAPKAKRTRRKKDPNTGELISATEYNERYGQNGPTDEELEAIEGEE